MARIKSALELALEKTESIKGDKSSIEQHELKQEGKRIAGAFLENLDINYIEEALKKFPKDKQETIKRGIFELLMATVQLPTSKDDLKKLEAIGKALSLIVPGKQAGILYMQLQQLFTRYLSEVEQYDQLIRRQYAPKLRQKEEELSRRLGREIKLDPFQDPEFVNFYNQNMNALKSHYQDAVDQGREQIRVLFEE
jgi:hypothetical protein